VLFSVLYGIWVAYYIAFKGDACRDVAAGVLALAEKKGSTVPLIIGHRVMGATLHTIGAFAEGRAHSDRAFALYDPVKHRPLATRFGSESGVSILGFRSQTLWYLGYPEAALTDAHRAVEAARDIGQTVTLMFALVSASWTLRLCRDYAVTSSLADELFALANEKGAPWWKAMGTLTQGSVLALTGRADAVETIISGLAALRSTEATTYIPTYLSYFAIAQADLGRFDDAWRSIDEAMTAVEATKEGMHEAEIRRTAGEIALKVPLPDAAKAQAYFERALAVARQQQAKSWELRAAMSLARLWRDQGKVQQARELLAPVYGWFTEGFDTLDLKEAMALLEELQ
jgi:predicted ATPase